MAAAKPLVVTANTYEMPQWSNGTGSLRNSC